MAKKIIELPKLPYGQGTYSWDNKEQTIIKYRKSIGTDDNKKYATVKATSIKECNDKMKQLEYEYDNEYATRRLKDPNNKLLTFSAASYNWMVTFKGAQLKGSAYDTIEATYNNQILTSHFANYQVESVIDVEIQNYLIYLKEKKYSVSTIKKTYSFINQFLKYYYRKRPYDNPMLTVAMPEFKNDIELDQDGNISNKSRANIEKQYAVLSDEEIKLFTKAATVEIIDGVQGFKHGWGLLFMMWSFIRNGEALGLQWKDIDFKNETALIYKTYSRIKIRDDNDTSGKSYKWSLSTVKTKSGVRKVILCKQAINALLEYKKIQNPRSESDFIFSTSSGLPISNSNLNISLKKILKNANISTHVSIHGLRHTGISYFIRHKVDKDIVAKMAGHSDKSVTDSVYYTILSDQQINEINKINNMMKDKKM